MTFGDLTILLRTFGFLEPNEFIICITNLLTISDTD
jgi:hypothetical protein